MRVWTIPLIFGFAVMLAFSPVTVLAHHPDDPTAAGECTEPPIAGNPNVGFSVGLLLAGTTHDNKDANANGWVCLAILVTPGTTLGIIYDDNMPSQAKGPK